MAQRNRWLFALALLAGIALLLGRSCGHDAAPAGDAATPSPSTAIDVDGNDTTGNAIPAAQSLSSQHLQAQSAAVDTLHRYLAALGAGEHDKANAFWANDRPPAQSNEADLRTLKGLRALRIENTTPRPLDSEAVPAAFEIPVVLRANLDDAPNRYYRGWYRLRALDPLKGDWEISSASVRVEQR